MICIYKNFGKEGHFDVHVQELHSIMFQDFGTGSPMEQINPTLSPLLFSMSFAGACLMVLDIVQSLLVKTGQDRSYSL